MADIPDGKILELFLSLWLTHLFPLFCREHGFLVAHRALQTQPAGSSLIVDCLSSKQPGCFCDPHAILPWLYWNNPSRLPRLSCAREADLQIRQAIALLLLSSAKIAVLSWLRSQFPASWLLLHIKIIVSMLLSDPKYEIHFYFGQKSLNCPSDIVSSQLIWWSGPPKKAVMYGSWH